MLVSASAVREIGLMEESYFLYWEDTEWCVRAHRLGYKTLFVPKSHVWHKVSASTGKDSFAQHYYYTRNGFSFLFRYGPVWVPVFVIYNLLYSLKCLAGGNSQALKGFFFGLAGFLRGETGPIARRESGKKRRG
jgi:GT2 family glycosyltransferase